MKILLLTPQLPYPPRQGAAMRNYNVLRLLSGRHDISLLSFADDGPDPEAIGHLETLCRSVTTVRLTSRSALSRLRGLFFSTKPDLVTRLPSRDFQNEIDRLLAGKQYDIVQVEGLELAEYVLPRLRKRGGRCPAPGPLFILDDHNAEYTLQKSAFETTWPAKPLQSVYSFIQWRKLRLYEARCRRMFDAVTAVSREDERALEDIQPGVVVPVISNGVDSDFYTPTSDRSRALEAGVPPDGPVVLFTATMDYRPNVDAMVWFAGSIWPQVIASRPATRLYIVGRNPSPEVRALEGRDGIHVTGSVDDVRPYMEAAAVFVVPMRMGGGVRLKALEAMSMELPVVSTTLGMSGIDFAPGEDAIVADDPRDFADQVCRLLADDALRAEMGRRAARVARGGYDWEEIVPRFDAVYSILQDREGRCSE
jgi:polysaccharide biosynthesis protein PslH